MKKIVMMIASIWLLSACCNIHTLKQVEPAGSPFQRHLFNMYKHFAEVEAEGYDWLDAKHFMDKAMMVASGKDAAPEEVKNWRLPAREKPYLEAAHDSLVMYLAKSRVLKEHPKTSAEAQFFYDCWIEQQEENWQYEDIEFCRKGFANAMTHLSQHYGKMGPYFGEKAERASQKVVKKRGMYHIFFGEDKDNLTKDMLALLDGVAKEIKNVANYEVTIAGHTDRQGEEVANLKLSKRRAQAVKKALMDRGVLGERMLIFAYGESNPMVKTKDGVAESKNRRVDVSVNK